MNIGADYVTGSTITDSGSSGRLTNMPDAFDFDFIVKLDPSDLEKVPQIKKDLLKALQGKPHPGDKGAQFRATDADILGNKVDVDVGFISKSELEYYESHHAVKEKLDGIKSQYGEDKYQEVIANIALAKKVLKEGNAYKKAEHGGVGGIGVETWVLQHGGSMLEAFKTFNEAAHQNGKLVDFSQFQTSYRILDPGLNARDGRHDNYVNRLTQPGYEAMAKSIEKYLSEVGP